LQLGEAAIDEGRHETRVDLQGSRQIGDRRSFRPASWCVATRLK
jgi:hypothetical protein